MIEKPLDRLPFDVTTYDGPDVPLGTLVKKPDMTVESFLDACERHGWYFTIQWVRRRLRELAKEASDAAQ